MTMTMTVTMTMTLINPSPSPMNKPQILLKQLNLQSMFRILTNKSCMIFRSLQNNALRHVIKEQLIRDDQDANVPNQNGSSHPLEESPVKALLPLLLTSFIPKTTWTPITCLLLTQSWPNVL
jgi:hypothetical protein